MVCYYPIHGFKRQDGSFTANARYGICKMTIPCGGCVGCRLKRAGEWAVRGTHEASLYLDNCFITLTYDKARLPDRPIGHAPADIGLYYPDFQEFMKRLREKYGSGIRFMVSGEYGDAKGRPHFHAILFNFNFPDRKTWYRTKQGHQVFRSASLEELWPWGNSDIGSVTPQSIGYVARYVMKKVTGKAADTHYDKHDPETGEIFSVEPEFAHYSLKPGIGAEWFAKFHASVYPHDYLIFNGKKVRPPRYYDKLYERMTAKPFIRVDHKLLDFSLDEWSDDFEAIKASRREVAELRLDDNTQERLYVREQVALAKLSRLPRKLS